MDILRALQGIGGAAIIPAAVRITPYLQPSSSWLTSFSGNTKIGILASSFPPSQARSIAFATFGAGAPIGERV